MALGTPKTQRTPQQRTFLAMASAVSGWSPVIIMTRMPAFLQRSTASGTPFLGGSMSEMSPTKVYPSCGTFSSSSLYLSSAEAGKSSCVGYRVGGWMGGGRDEHMVVLVLLPPVKQSTPPPPQSKTPRSIVKRTRERYLRAKPRTRSPWPAISR